MVFAICSGIIEVIPCLLRLCQSLDMLSLRYQQKQHSQKPDLEASILKVFFKQILTLFMLRLDFGSQELDEKKLSGKLAPSNFENQYQRGPCRLVMRKYRPPTRT